MPQGKADDKVLMVGVLILSVLSSKGYNLKCLLENAQKSRVFGSSETAGLIGLP